MAHPHRWFRRARLSYSGMNADQKYDIFHDWQKWWLENKDK